MKKNQKGFTIIELVLVMLVTSVLLALVVTTYSGVQTKNRNSQRQKDIDKLQNGLETYYAQYTKYPTLTDANSAKWRTSTNIKDLSQATVQDPKWDNNKACIAGTAAVLSAMPAQGCYSYQVSTSDGSPCSAQVPCAQYTLTTMLEGGQKYTKSSPN